jgi:hypothetical protein
MHKTAHNFGKKYQVGDPFLRKSFSGKANPRERGFGMNGPYLNLK